MVNEEVVKASDDDEEKLALKKVVTLTTPNKQCTVTLLALPLQTEAVNLIEMHQDLLKVTIFQSMSDLDSFFLTLTFQKNRHCAWEFWV